MSSWKFGHTNIFISYKLKFITIMNQKSFFHTFPLFLLLSAAALPGARGLIEDHAKERNCFEIKETAQVDLKWLESMKTQYYPAMSFLDLYRIVKEILQTDWEHIELHKIYYDSCISFHFDETDSYVGRGFGDRQFRVDVDQKSSSSSAFGETTQTFPYSGITETCYTTLTDNSTFYFEACCFSDNQMSWGVASSKPTLPKDVVTRIHEHAVSLGFRKEYFTQLRYDHCKWEDPSKKSEQ